MSHLGKIDRGLMLLLLLFPLASIPGCRESGAGDAAVVATHSGEATDAPRTSPSHEEEPRAESSRPDCCKSETPPAPATEPRDPKPEVVIGRLAIPDVTLIDQDGRPVNVRRDLARDKLLVMNFIFTTCKGVCPPLGVNFGQLQGRLGGRLGQDVNLVSVSVDPVTDTPERLKAWGKQFGASPGWTLLTGPKQDVDRLLKGLGVFTANKTEHSPFILMGRASEGSWRRIHGLTPPAKLSELVLGMLDSRDSSVQNGPSSDPQDRGDPADTASPAQRYFTDVILIDQHGKPMRLYSDVLKGKVVVITPFFTSCRASCPKLIDTFVKLQSYFEDRLGKELFLVSMTVDPDTDRPDTLKAYAERLHALPGWSFLTGEKEDVYAALYKLGQRVRAREDHSNIFLIGNEKTGLWKKAMGLAPPAEIIRIVESVLNDERS
jgi:cytochrome oxidase Cu insertion factor (SCO1/SenC/PrrC family)